MVSFHEQRENVYIWMIYVDFNNIVYLRIDNCDQLRFWECSYISGANCMI